ncbi:hypothetical protein PanWU01x14_284280, partial [Parasponia andersonii]
LVTNSLFIKNLMLSSIIFNKLHDSLLRQNKEYSSPKLSTGGAKRRLINNDGEFPSCNTSKKSRIDNVEEETNKNMDSASPGARTADQHEYTMLECTGTMESLYITNLTGFGP